MNATRRVFLGLYSLLLIALAGGLIALTWNQDRQADVSPGNWRGVAFVEAGDTAKTIATLVFAAAIALGLFTLLLAVAQLSRRSRGTLELKQTDGGTVHVTGSALERLLKGEIERLPEVLRADPRVRVRRGRVEPDIRATIVPATSISHATTSIASATRQTLQEQVGVTSIRRPAIRIQYDESAAGRARGLTPERIPTVAERPAGNGVPAERPVVEREERPAYPPEPAGLRERDRSPEPHD